MNRLLRNWQLKVLGLFIAGTTWSVVAYANNPPSAQGFKGVVIEHAQPPAGLVLLSEPAPVTVTVRGLQSSLGNFSRESLHASVDMSNAHRGTNLLPVKVRVDSPDRSVVFASVDPANADVELDALATAQRKVDIRTTGAPNTCCVVGAGTTTPDTVTLKGPAKQLETAVAYVVVDVSGRGTPVQQTETVQVSTPDHKPLPQVSAAPGQVSLSQDIAAVKQDKPAGINPVISGQLAPGFVIVDIQLSPDVLQVEADPGILAAIHTIDTDPISVSGATNDIVATVNLRPPNGVTVLTKGPFTVHLVIRLSAHAQPTPSPSPAPTPT